MWIILAIFFVILEIFTPGLLALWFGVGCFVVAVLTFSKITIGIASQIIVWAISSCILLLFWHTYYKKGLFKSKKLQASELSGLAEGELIGKRGNLMSEINPSQPGKVKLHAPVYGLSEWDATSTEKLEAGIEVEVLGVEGTKLIVRRV